MTKFEQAFNKLIFNEGGYVNDKDDSGGETYMGISRKYNPNLDIWNVIDKVKEIYNTNNSITKILKNNNELTNKIKKFYKENYWDVLNLNKVNNFNLAYQIFDSAVNIGIKRTKILLSKII